MPRDLRLSQVPRRGRFLVRSIPGLSGHAGDGGPLWRSPREPPRMWHGPEASVRSLLRLPRFWKWFDPKPRPFLPVPRSRQSNSGTTNGILPVGCAPMNIMSSVESSRRIFCTVLFRVWLSCAHGYPYPSQASSVPAGRGQAASRSEFRRRVPERDASRKEAGPLRSLFPTRRTLVLWKSPTESPQASKELHRNSKSLVQAQIGSEPPATPAAALHRTRAASSSATGTLPGILRSESRFGKR